MTLTMQPFEPFPNPLRFRERLPRGRMRPDEASEIDDQRPDVKRHPVRHPQDVPVTLRLQQRVEQIDVLLGNASVTGISGAPARERSGRRRGRQ